MLDRGEVRDRAAHADERSRASGRPSRRAEVGGDRVERRAQRLVGDGAVEAEALGEARRADVEAEALVDLLPVAERELRAAAAGVEDDERAAAEPQPGLDGEVGEPRLLLAADHLDLDAGALAHGVDEHGAVGRDAAARPCRRPRSPRPRCAGLVGHRRDRVDGPLDRLVRERAGLVEAFAEPGDLGAVDDRRPLAVGLPLADVELDRVRADVDDREAPRSEPDERLEPAGHAHVPPRAEAELADRRDHASRDPPTRPRSFGALLARCESRRPPPCSRRRCSGRAACARRPQAGRRSAPTSSSISCSSVYSLRDSGGPSTPSAASTAATSSCAEREGRLQDRLPLLEPVGVDGSGAA